jgi:hypothetical protein
MTNPDSVTAPALPEWGNIPIYRKLWLVGIINALGVALSFVNVLASLAVLLPGLILLWMGPVYKRKKGAVVLHRTRDKVTFCIILVFVLGWNLMRQGGGMAGMSLSSELPTCESRTAQSSLKDAVKNSPKGRRMQLEIQEIIKAGTTSQPWLWNSQEAVVKDQKGEVQIYLCEAEVITNGGRQTVLYGISWADKTKGKWVIEARF